MVVGLDRRWLPGRVRSVVVAVALEQGAPRRSGDFHRPRLAISRGLSLRKGDQRIGQTQRRNHVASGCLRQLDEGLIEVVSAQGDEYPFGGVKDPVGAAAWICCCAIGTHVFPMVVSPVRH